MIAAAAVAATPGPAAYMGFRAGASDAGAETDSARNAAVTPPASSNENDKGPALSRYSSLAFVYNQDAARLVMLYRSPSTGETVSQIPSEVALKRYEAAARPDQQVAGARGADQREEEGSGTSNKEAGKGAGKGTGTETSATIHAIAVAANAPAAGAETGTTGTGTGAQTGGSGKTGASGSGRVDVMV